MNLAELIQPGMANQGTFFVREENLAIHVGSGSSPVLATPWMIVFMERLAHQLLENYLPGDYSSVGVHVDVRHVSPTPIGEDVRVHAEVREVDGMRVKFYIQAWDEHGQIGDGEHERVVIDVTRFMKKVESKKHDDRR